MTSEVQTLREEIRKLEKDLKEVEDLDVREKNELVKVEYRAKRNILTEKLEELKHRLLEDRLREMEELVDLISKGFTLAELTNEMLVKQFRETLLSAKRPL